MPRIRHCANQRSTCKSLRHIAEARSIIGWHRVEIARHYPTDTYAGRVLAQAIVKQMVKSEAFQNDFAEAKAEIATA
jgi:acid phosphatase (class A)